MSKFLASKSARLGLSLAFVAATMFAIADQAHAVAVAVTPDAGVDVGGTVAAIGLVIFAILAAVIGISVGVLTTKIGYKFVKGLQKT